MSAADGTGIGTVVQAGFAFAKWANRNTGFNREQRAAANAAVAAGYRHTRQGWRTPDGRVILERDVLRAGRQILAGGSAADVMPPAASSSVPWYAAVFGAPAARVLSQKERAAVKRMLDRMNIEQMLRDPKTRRALYLKAKGREAVATLRKQLPKIAKPILRRIPKGAGPLIAAQVAYQVGFEIGSAIYRGWERYAYGPARPAKPAAGAPGTPTATVSPSRPGTPKVPTPAPAPRPAAPRSTAPAAPQPKPKVPAPGTVTVARAPSPAPAPVIRSPAPAPRRSSMTLPRQLAAAAAVQYVLGKTNTARRSQTQPLPLTQTQGPPIRYTPTRTDTCECKAPAKRRSANRCRNPVVRRTKRTRGGQKFITITRRVEC